MGLQDTIIAAQEEKIKALEKRIDEADSRAKSMEIRLQNLEVVRTVDFFLPFQLPDCLVFKLLFVVQ